MTEQGSYEDDDLLNTQEKKWQFLYILAKKCPHIWNLAQIAKEYTNNTTLED